MAGAPDRSPARLPPIATALPSLVLGTATFNTQYVADPRRMPSGQIVSRALSLGIRAFDTSPYYGPSEEILGRALAGSFLAGLSLSRAGGQEEARQPRGRADVFLITKVGRIASAEFDYSEAWVRSSVARSLARLRTSYLDLVYAHDAEFVTPAEVVAAVRALRALRAEGKVRYVGISGYPVAALADLAERVVRETGEPLDAVQSYGHCTLQNAALTDPALLSRLRGAGVGLVLNASLLNMGLLTTRGVDAGPQAAWHPSPPRLRAACARAAAAAADAGETLEGLALRFGMDQWAHAAAAAGLGAWLAAVAGGGRQAVGVSVIGVTSVGELNEAVAEWQGVLDGLAQAAPGNNSGSKSNSSGGDDEQPRQARLRRDEVAKIVKEKLWPALGEWRDYSWSSPPEGWMNQRKQKDAAKL